MHLTNLTILIDKLLINLCIEYKYVRLLQSTITISLALASWSTFPYLHVHTHDLRAACRPCNA